MKLKSLNNLSSFYVRTDLNFLENFENNYISLQITSVNLTEVKICKEFYLKLEYFRFINQIITCLNFVHSNQLAFRQELTMSDLKRSESKSVS